MSINRVIKQISLGLTIMIMAMLLVNKAVYVHVHVLADGSLVTHAHPFNKNAESSGAQQHQHSSLEFFIFHGFELLILGALTSAALLLSFKELKKHWSTRTQPIPGLQNTSQGRAPPYCM